MLHWLFSRPLQVKFFFSTALLVSAALLVLMLNVLQVLNQFLTHHVEQDMQQSTHILAMALMVGPAAHDPNDLRQLLQNVQEMHGYCYLAVLDNAGKLLASSENNPALRPADAKMTSPDSDGDCFDGTIPLSHDGNAFGTLHYGVETGYFEELKHTLRIKLFIVSALWLVVGAAVYFLLVHRLVQPLRAITRASESMAHGNLNAVMPKDLPQDELGLLATSLSNMAASLRQRIESQQSYAHALYAEQARLNALVSILPVGIMFVDPERRVQFINQECRRLWGLSENEDYLDQHDIDLIAHARNMMEQPDFFIQHVDSALKEYGIGTPFDTKLLTGRTIRSRSCVVPDASGERYIGRIWMFQDVSEEHARLHAAHARAERDALTTLYNRHRFEADLEHMFAQAQRNDRRLSLLYFDLDDFKSINDRFGHASGDKVLKAIAQAVTLQARRNEIVYRLGGDEFAILVADSSPAGVEALARRVTETIGSLQFNFTGHTVQIQCSMGIATYPLAQPTGTALELVQHADLAMYQAKHFGKNRWQMFDPDLPLDLGKDSR